jgi:hypothetical protein
MVDQLFRTEAVDAYTERWLGEVSELRVIRPLPLALLGIGMLTAVIATLIFGSSGRQTTLRGVFTGAREEALVIGAGTPPLRVGEELPLHVQAANAACGSFSVRVAAVTPLSASGGQLYRLTLQIPGALRREAGARFLLDVRLERRHICQWMFPCLCN